ncbi:ferredoxin [Dactylosporangium sp. CA-092794]|uniref:ferredoxin n=1 Tax=Dactylosporangium sp. CA-092794 TaxID=3239929 RepID=UPI003D91568E
MSSSEVTSSVRVAIDRAKCQGHGRCYALNPDLFEADDEGYGQVRDLAVPPAVAQGAVLDCPELAISVLPNQM